MTAGVKILLQHYPGDSAPAALSAHLLQQADTYSPASNSLQKPFASENPLLKVKQDQNVLGRQGEQRRFPLPFTELKGVSEFAQSSGWVSGP